jgi:hypothetical protein
MQRTTVISLLLAAAALSGCDMFGESAEKLAANKEAEGKAIGSACRHAGRAIEDCYSMNRKADKASVFSGWRDMNDYMRENKIEAVPPQAMAAKAEPRSTEGKIDTKVVSEPVIEGIDKRPVKSVVGSRGREPKAHD